MEDNNEIRFAPGLVIAELKGNGREYMEMYSRYSSAMLEVETKFKVLNIEFSSKFDRNPIETIKTRLKRPASIVEKMKRIGVPLGESYRPEIIDRVSEDFLRLKPLYLLLRQAADAGMAKLDA